MAEESEDPQRRRSKRSIATVVTTAVIGALASAAVGALLSASQPVVQLVADSMLRGDFFPSISQQDFTLVVAADQGRTHPSVIPIRLTETTDTVRTLVGDSVSFTIRGYTNGDQLVLAYRSKVRVGLGFGHLLLRRSSTGAYYGYMTGNSAPADRPVIDVITVRCAVVMVRGTTDEIFEYADWVNRHGCVRDELPSDPLQAPD